MRYVSVALVIVISTSISESFDNWSPRKHKISLGQGNDEHHDAFDINAKSEEEEALDGDYYYHQQEDDYEDESSAAALELGDLELQKDNDDYEEAKSGIHIHIQDSVLNALLEKVPWAEVFESLNNKLSRTEETKHIQEHIYKLAKAQNDYDHRHWNNQRQDGRSQQQWCHSQLTYNQWQQCHQLHRRRHMRQQLGQTWRNPKGHEEYTFRHTIIQKVQKDKPNQRRWQRPAAQWRLVRRNQYFA